MKPRLGETLTPRFQQHGRPAQHLLSGSHAVSTRGVNGEEKVAAPPTPPGEELLGSAGPGALGKEDSREERWTEGPEDPDPGREAPCPAPPLRQLGAGVQSNEATPGAHRVSP